MPPLPQAFALQLEPYPARQETTRVEKSEAPAGLYVEQENVYVPADVGFPRKSDPAETLLAFVHDALTPSPVAG